MSIILVVDFEDGVDKITKAIASRYTCDVVDDISYPQSPIYIELRGEMALYASNVKNLPCYRNHETIYCIDIVKDTGSFKGKLAEFRRIYKLSYPSKLY